MGERTENVEIEDRSAILELLARVAWAADERLVADFIAEFTDDAVVERTSRDGATSRWAAQDGTLAGYVSAAGEGVSVEDRQTWNSDVTFSRWENGEVHVSSTALRVGSGGGGTSNVVLGDDRVHDVVVCGADGWRIRHRIIRLLGLGDEVGPPPVFDEAAAGGQSDRVEIEALFADYAWAVDTADVDAVMQLFSVDAVMQDPFGRFAGSGPDGVRLFFEGLFARPEFAGRMHMVSQLMLAPVGDDYRVDSYALVPAAFPNGAVNVHLLAFYRDVVRREDGQWKFVERLVGPRWERGEVDSGSKTT